MFLGGHLASQTRVLEDRNTYTEAHFSYKTKVWFPNVLVLGSIKKGLGKYEGPKNM